MLCMACCYDTKQAFPHSISSIKYASISYLYAYSSEWYFILYTGKDKLLDQLHNLPLRNDTLRLHNTRNELEGKLSEIDDAVKIFSRPRVFIKQDWRIYFILFLVNRWYSYTCSVSSGQLEETEGGTVRWMNICQRYLTPYERQRYSIWILLNE